VGAIGANEWAPLLESDHANSPRFCGRLSEIELTLGLEIRPAVHRTFVSAGGDPKPDRIGRSVGLSGGLLDLAAEGVRPRRRHEGESDDTAGTRDRGHSDDGPADDRLEHSVPPVHPVDEARGQRAEWLNVPPRTK